jgi:hypothetical protein
MTQYPEFEVGAKMKALKDINFIGDNQAKSHKKGQVIVVTEENKSYFSVCWQSYEVVK